MQLPQSSTGISGGIMFYDALTPGVIGPSVINSFTTLSIPSYWAAIRFIYRNLAAFPRHIAKDGVPVPHRLDTLLKRRPNAQQNASMFWSTLFLHATHCSNGYAEIQRDSQYNPIGLENRVPEIVLPFRWDDEDGIRRTYYYVGANNGIPAHVAPSADIIHLIGSMSYDGFSGMNQVWLQSETFERARTVDRYITRFLMKGSVIRGSIEVPAGMTADQQQTFVDTLRQNFTGPDADRDVIVLTEGAKLNNATLSNDQAQTVQLAGYSTKQISQLTGVPPVFLFENSEAKYNSSVEEAFDMAARDLFRPLLHHYESEMSLKLLTPAEQDAGLEFKFDMKDLFRGNTTVQSASTIAETNAGLITKNEGRKVLGYPQSNDPEANKLITLGSSTPPKPATAPATATEVKNSKPPALEHFTTLLTAATTRVETKTSKANDNAMKKHQGDDLTRWANVFSGEQSRYAAEALTPILKTIGSVTNTEPHDATKIGESYATALRGHYSKIVRGEESALPTLTNILFRVLEPQASVT